MRTLKAYFVAFWQLLFSHRDEGDDHEDFSVFGGVEGDPFKDSFFHFETHIQKQMEAMSRQMEEMFKNFGAVEFPSGKVRAWGY